MARCFAGMYASGNTSTGMLSVSASADQFGCAFNMATRGRLSGDLWLHGGNAYGVSQVKVHSTSIEFKIHTYFGPYIEMSDNGVSMSLPTVGESPSFPANSKYYLNALGDVADVANNTINTLGTIGAIAGVVAMSTPGGGAINLAKTALPVVKPLMTAVIGAGVISAAAKYGNQMLTDPPTGAGGIRITENSRYLICVADLMEGGSVDIRDASGSNSAKPSVSSSHTPSYEQSYGTYDRTSNYNNRAQRETGTSPMSQAVSEISGNAWNEFEITIRDSFNSSGATLSEDPAKWSEAKGIFEGKFNEALANIINAHDQDFNDDRLKIDDIKATSALVDELKAIKEDAQKANDTTDETATNEAMTFQNWVKLFNRYFQKRDSNTIMALLDGEIKADILKDNSNVAETTDLYIPVQSWGVGDELL